MNMRFAVPVLALVLTTAPAVLAQDMKASSDQPTIVKAKDLAFNPISVPGFNEGLKIAVLSGDPSKEGQYAIRLAFPDGYSFPPHWHPQLENLTVISGTFYLGMGEKVDKSAAREYLPGDYLVAPAHNVHFGWVKGETVIQLHGTGPFEINVVK